MSIANLTKEDIVEICKSDDIPAMVKKHTITKFTVMGIKKYPERYLQKFEPKKSCDLCKRNFYMKYQQLALCQEHFGKATASMLGGFVGKFKHY